MEKTNKPQAEPNAASKKGIGQVWVIFRLPSTITVLRHVVGSDFLPFLRMPDAFWEPLHSDTFGNVCSS